MVPGEEKAWQLLDEASPDIICHNAGARFNESAGRYMLTSYGMDFSISPKDKLIESDGADSGIFLGRFSYFFRLSVLRYLLDTKDIGLSGRLVKPENLTGGLHFFSMGSHVMPLDKVAGKYANDIKGFTEKCVHFGGQPVKHGDAAFVFLPFPKMPVTILLWAADEEFDARVDLLLDSSCELQLPIDIIWNTCMMSLLMLL